MKYKDLGAIFPETLLETLLVSLVATFLTLPLAAAETPNRLSKPGQTQDGLLAILDQDQDGVPDVIDNCIDQPNRAQKDCDNDGYGDRCDADANNDGLVTFADLDVGNPCEAAAISAGTKDNDQASGEPLPAAFAKECLAVLTTFNQRIGSPPGPSANHPPEKPPGPGDLSLSCPPPETNPLKITPESPLNQPALQVTINDPDLGACFKRVTDVASVDNGDFIKIDQAGPIYAQNQAYNATETLRLTHHNALWSVETGEFLHQIRYASPTFGGALKWSPTDPLKLYYVGGTRPAGRPDPYGVDCPAGQARLMSYTLEPGSTPLKGKHELVHCFPEYSSLHKDASSEEISEDGRYLALEGVTGSAGNEYHVFAYDLLEKKPLATLHLPVTDTRDGGSKWRNVPNWVAMSPSGQYVLIMYTLEGLIAYHRDTMRYAGQVSMTGAHGDLGVGIDGTEYYVYTGSSQYQIGEYSRVHNLLRSRIPDGIVFKTSDVAGTKGVLEVAGGVLEVDGPATIASGGTISLLELDWGNSSLHVSCRNIHDPGWCVFSTYGKPKDKKYAFEGEIFRVFLDSTPDAPHVERFLHHRTNPRVCSYWATPFATSSPSGTKIMFGSAWDWRSGDCTVDAFEIDLSTM